MRLTPFLAGSVISLALSACASSPEPRPPMGPPPGLFVSPFGELFFSEPGQPWPTAAWFAGADADADGSLTLEEFAADGARVFASLDRVADGRLTPDEIARYEQDLASARSRMPGVGGPGMRPPGGFPGGPGGPGFPSNLAGSASAASSAMEAAPQQRPGGGGMPGGGMPGGGGMGEAPRMRAPTGPLAYGPIAAAGFFNYPQPVKAADLDMNQVVTLQEWGQAAERWFLALDTDGDGVLTLATLPKTPLQEIIERGRP